MKKYLLVGLLLCFLPTMAAEKVIPHEDRATPKIIYQPNGVVSGQAKERVAEVWLRGNAGRLGLQPGATNISLARVQKSLLGTHYHYQQTLLGTPVDRAEVIVSVNEKNGEIYRVFNNTWPEPDQVGRQKAVELDREEALHMAWEHLRVHGGLKALPEAEQIWIVEDGHFRLSWRTQLITDAPFGNWSVVVDAMTGKVISAEDITIYRNERETQRYQDYQGPLTDRISDTKRIEAIEAERAAKRYNSNKRAQGTGNTFDPDPRTTLNTEAISDNSPDSDFTDAYFSKDLLDITNNGGVFSLTGPWVDIIDFESPTTAPSTTNDGVWNFTRGNNAFNDSMTYFQLDQNQRYIQSLGFTGDKGIQDLSMEVDTDGFQGFDNSHYLSGFTTLGVNRLAFGHGCVDDNEDADVILHEYGHAIQKFINLNWNGGDTGAMGEGFGDYWGAAYSYTTPNGKTFNPAWIYSWDGHNECWGGRDMDKTSLVYNSGTTYGAHSSIPGGVSDELWGTPLFQAMVALDAQGHPTSEADAIILEAHFGFGSGVRMPELAEATVNAALAMFPNGPHAQAFHQAFAQVNIPTTDPGGPTETYTYLSAHVPPDNDWVNEIQLINPGTGSASITATVYELGDSGFSANTPENLTLAGGEATTYTPGGSAQRWVHFESDQPLAGTSFFSRNVVDRGEEKAGVPLFRSSETGTSIIIPHIPADRAFFSGAVFLNPNNATANLTYELYDADGNDVSNLITNDAPTSLGAFEKWVGFLAPFTGLPSLFDDETGGGALVSYVKINADQPLAAFELFGYKADNGTSPLATAGIKALPDQTITTYPVRSALTDSIFTSFSVLNPADSAADINVEAFDFAGASLGSASASVPARGKLLGLNINNPDDVNQQFFRFPVFGSTLIEHSNPAEVAHIVITGPAGLRIFELAGSGTSEIDGGAVTAAGTTLAFAKPSGIIEIFNLGETSNVTVVGTLGEVTDNLTQAVPANGYLNVQLEGTLDTLIVTGTNLSVSQITRNATDGSLSVVNGDSVETTSGK